jgi:uncharacterized protein
VWIIDAGPLVAFLDRSDAHHGWVVEMLGSTNAPLVTCEAVLGEAFYLLRGMFGSADGLIGLLQDKQVTVAFDARQNLARVLELMRKYADVPVSFADACLVAMSENLGSAPVFTLDSDFLVYRRHARERIPLVAPFA